MNGALRCECDEGMRAADWIKFQNECPCLSSTSPCRAHHMTGYCGGERHEHCKDDTNGGWLGGNVGAPCCCPCHGHHHKVTPEELTKVSDSLVMMVKELSGRVS